MGHILIAGCGYVGSAAADLFFQAGWSVEGWTRSAETAARFSHKAYPVYAIDISATDQIAARSIQKVDVVVHCASTRGGDVEAYRHVYWDGATNLLTRFGGARFVLTSSTSVYAQKNGAWVTERDLAEPAHETGKVLRETEEFVLAQGGTIARLAGIYGPDRSALLQRFLAGEATIDLENDRFINQVHRGDVVAALFLLVERTMLRGEIYNVVDDHPVRQREYYSWLAGRLHAPLPPTGSSSSKGKRGRSNKRVSNAKLRGLGWTPKYPSFVEGMEESVLPSFGLRKE